MGEIITISEAAEILNVHENTLRHHVKKGLVKHTVTKGGQLRFDMDDLVSIDEQKEKQWILVREHVLGAKAYFDILEQSYKHNLSSGYFYFINFAILTKMSIMISNCLDIFDDMFSGNKSDKYQYKFSTDCIALYYAFKNIALSENGVKKYRDLCCHPIRIKQRMIGNNGDENKFNNQIAKDTIESLIELCVCIEKEHFSTRLGDLRGFSSSFDICGIKECVDVLSIQREDHEKYENLIRELLLDKKAIIDLKWKKIHIQVDDINQPR